MTGNFSDYLDIATKVSFAFLAVCAVLFLGTLVMRVLTRGRRRTARSTRLEAARVARELDDQQWLAQLGPDDDTGLKSAIAANDQARADQARTGWTAR